MYDLFDGPLGRNNDRHFMGDSNLNNIINAACALLFLLATMFWSYTDRGFTSDTNVAAAHHGPAAVTPQQFHDNITMACVRVCIERTFAKVKQVCPLITRKSILKLSEKNVPKLIIVAVLQTNVHTCLKQSQTGLYFNCRPPTLHQYFALV